LAVQPNPATSVGSSISRRHALGGISAGDLLIRAERPSKRRVREATFSRMVTTLDASRRLAWPITERSRGRARDRTSTYTYTAPRALARFRAHEVAARAFPSRLGSATKYFRLEPTIYYLYNSTLNWLHHDVFKESSTVKLLTKDSVLFYAKRPSGVCSTMLGLEMSPNGGLRSSSSRLDW
jgi:hypothetical protein